MISNVTLKNFKCFAETSVACQRLTVLAGVNGAGKSSVLQALLLLRQSYRSSANSNELVIDGEYINLGTARDIFFQHAIDDLLQISISQTASNSHAVLGESITRHTWTFTYDEGSNAFGTISTHDQSAAAELELFGDDFQYLEAERVGPRITSIVPERRTREKGLGNKGEFAAYHLAIFGDMHVPNARLLHPKESRPGLLRQVEAWLGEISPGTQLTVLPHLSMDVVQLQFSFPAGRTLTAELRPTNVGFGLSYVLPILVALLEARPGALLILENPEAHLHPRGQVQLGRLIAKCCQGNVQIFVETHSDHLLNGIRLAVRNAEIEPNNVSLLFFARDNTDTAGSTSVRAPKIDRDGRIDEWPPGFFDEFMKASIDLLRPLGESANTNRSE